MKSKKILTNPVWIVIIAVICNILWGSAFPFIKVGYQEFQITTDVSQKLLFAGVRFFLSGVILLVTFMIVYRRLPKVKSENVRNVAELALVQTTLQYIFFYIGLSNTTATNGSIVNSMNVFISAIVAHIVYKNDKMNTRKWIGCIFGFAGVLCVTTGDGAIQFAINGEGFIIIAGVMFAVGSVISKKATQIDDSMLVTGMNLAAGGFILILLGVCSGGSLSTITGKGCAVLVYLALLSAISFTLWAMLLKYNPIGKICIYNFVIPISGTVLSAIMLREDIFKLKYFISLVLVTIGICIVNRKKTKDITDKD